MTSFILYISLAIIGYFIAGLLTKKGIALKGTGIIQTITVVVLVFVMGSRIGADESIFRSLGTIGVMALVLTFFIQGGSLLAILFARKLMGFDKKGIRGGDSSDTSFAAIVQLPEKESVKATEQLPITESSEGATQPPEPEKEKTDYTMLFCILIPVALGILSGYLFLPQSFLDITGTIIDIGLSIILFLVGYDLGVEGTIVANFKRAGWRIITFPFLVMAGTFIGAAAAAVILPLSMQDAMCVGAGFGWYSLAPIMLAEYSLEVSAISFMHNVMRELFSILLIPFIAKKIGYIETLSLPACCAMDVCLPVIVRATNGNTVVYALISGAVLSASVPLMVSLMMSL